MVRPCPPVVTILRRPWHLLDVDALRAALSTSRLCQPVSWTDCSTDQLAELYSSEVVSLLDDLVPATTVTTRRRPSDPWFDQECRQTKRVVRRLARSARLDDVDKWMRSNRLQLNTSKTEILWSTTGRRIHLLPKSPLRVGTDEVIPAFVVHDLGIHRL